MSNEFERVEVESDQSRENRGAWSVLNLQHHGQGPYLVGTSNVTIESELNKLQMIIDVVPEPKSDTPVRFLAQNYVNGHWTPAGDWVAKVRGERIVFGGVGRVLCENPDSPSKYSFFRVEWNKRT